MGIRQRCVSLAKNFIVKTFIHLPTARILGIPSIHFDAGSQAVLGVRLHYYVPRHDCNALV